MSRRYSSVTWTEICAFWGMVVAGFTHFFGGLFHALVNWAFSDSNAGRILNRIADICTLLGNIALLVAIALPAWQFVSSKSSRGWKVFYWISFALFVIGVVFGVVIQF